MNNFDLHNHSNASDGMLSPAALMQLAHDGACDAVALTDHDTTEGMPEAETAANQLGLRLIKGVEISVSWRPDDLNTTIHIVGLNIDIASPSLQQGLKSVRQGRTERARLMAQDFERIGITGTFEGAAAIAENKAMIARTHFARHLVASGVVKNTAQAFNRYLVNGKPGYVPHQWASLAQSVEWIHAAGGVVVLAHPGRYKISKEQNRELLAEFKALGGEAVEVVTGSHQPHQYREYAALAKEFGLMASRGADFHGDGEGYYKPGKLPPLPAGLVPVWSVF